MRIHSCIAASALLVLAGTASAQINFLGNFGGKAYYYNTTPLTWSNARAAALAFSPGVSDLIAINSSLEEDFLKTVIPPPNNGPNPWLGFTKAANPGGGASAFQWVTGEPVTYTNWAGDADFASVTRNYASWNWSNPGRVWLNLADDGTPFGLKPSIIEVVPAPGAGALLGLGILAVARRRR